MANSILRSNRNENIEKYKNTINLSFFFLLLSLKNVNKYIPIHKNMMKGNVRIIIDHSITN